MDSTTRQAGMHMHDLLKAMRLAKQRRAAARGTVPVGSLGLLAEIDRISGSCRARELAVQAGLDPSTVSRTLAALVAEGLVVREPDPHDGRATMLVVTDAGRAALADAMDWYGRLLTGAFDGWSDNEVAVFTRGLARFTEALENTITTDNSLEAAR
ncbi:MarR family winged helix-turn-helix transcriptional regulator [Paractinoplanes lichenicola]|uniref:MarR family transcriptional regulator n=1 Tax=Paractinoplanes lichenicola TaxID=2802976 RepID=A0ABS1VP29_9ACTN|nr:MarR family transcriptional regulator [Actinoplanes lichenicola]MBL7255975.1 MarR family transcriptional regulator [Actinoplanes lichenicola]